MSRSDPSATTGRTPLVDDRLPVQLARECPLDIYLSGNDGGGHGSTYFGWAYRMNNPKEVGATYVDDCDSFILDSGIMHEDVTNEDVIDQALEHSPEYVFPADVAGDPEKTTDRVIDFLNMMDDAGVASEPIIPLQPTTEGGTDHHEHYPNLERYGESFAIGGVMDAPAAAKRDAVENVRAVAGDDVALHGLGFGMGYFTDPRVLRDLQLDSLDSSSPIQQAKSGTYWSFVDGELTKHEGERPPGDFALLQIAMLSGSTLISLARMVMWNAENAEELGHRQSGLGGF